MSTLPTVERIRAIEANTTVETKLIARDFDAALRLAFAARAAANPHVTYCTACAMAVHDGERSVRVPGYLEVWHRRCAPPTVLRAVRAAAGWKVWNEVVELAFELGWRLLPSSLKRAFCIW